jgi:ferrous iron transport protein B
MPLKRVNAENGISQTIDSPSRAVSRPLKIALAGNPNSGKTSLFNRITGAMQKVGNWGGVTVELKEGHKVIDGVKVTFVDLPGTYSLSALTEDELVARNYLVDENPDVVINVVDTTNLDRHLYLTVQLMELGIRPVVALNMWDELSSRGIVVDVKQLETLLGCPVVPTSARTGEGIDSLIERAVAAAKAGQGAMPPLKTPLPAELEKAIEQVGSLLLPAQTGKFTPHWVALKLFERDKSIERLVQTKSQPDEIFKSRDRLAGEISAKLGYDPETSITENRYGYIAGLVREVTSRTRQNAVDLSDKIDSVLTHRFWAYPIFVAFMWLLFQATFKLGEHPMGWIEAGIEWLMGAAQAGLPEGLFRDMVVDGIIAGVGGVIVFLPNILILFLGISIMEDTGYMARAAFIMDRLMHKIGLHGKSFIPMLMGMGCSVPAIMAARTLESRSDRIKTILLTPLISCSARLPVFVLFAGALFPQQAGNMVFLFQVVFGFAAFIGMAILFKVTLFHGSEDMPFVMELPPYRIPTGRSVLIHMWQKAEHYMKKMGGVVLVFSVVLWWAGVFPRAPHI